MTKLSVLLAGATGYISQRDLQQLFCKSIEAPEIADEYGVPFQISYGISNNARTFWSISNARKVIGLPARGRLGRTVRRG
jgi:hypothetical protein